jgi:hypothetical protein
MGQGEMTMTDNIFNNFDALIEGIAGIELLSRERLEAIRFDTRKGEGRRTGEYSGRHFSADEVFVEKVKEAAAQALRDQRDALIASVKARSFEEHALALRQKAQNVRTPEDEVEDLIVLAKVLEAAAAAFDATSGQKTVKRSLLRVAS